MAFQDFSGQNLRGRSFKGQNVEGADFSHADIRGANFSHAYLKGANFSHAQAGLQKRWAIFLGLISCLLSGISGFFGLLNGYFVSLIFNFEWHEQFIGWTSLIGLIGFYIITIYQGLIVGSVVLSLALALILILALLIEGAVNGAGSLVLTLTLPVALSVVEAIVGVVAVAVALSITGTLSIAGVVFIAIVAALALARPGARFVSGDLSYPGPLVVVLVVTLAVALVNAYIAWRAMKGDERNSWVCKFAIALATTKGTIFYKADLTDADFSLAWLKNTDLRKSILIRTYLYQVRMLGRTRSGKTYIHNPQIRELVVTKQGQDKNFDRLDLRGINLQKANLTDASFIGADLSEANLQDADLSRAKLVQTQLDSTDFTGATLTGAYIQDWGITSGTKFDGVRCEYVYMRLPTKEKPDPLRKPDNNREVFADGDFGDFIKPIFDTLDLYHNQEVDPRAIAIAFKELAEKNPNAELEIVAIERRGEDKILLHAKTAAMANKSELSKEYFINYNQLKELAENDFRALIANQETQIRELTSMIKTALKGPHFYAKTYINQGDTTMIGDRTINTGGGNYNKDIQGNYIQGNDYSRNLNISGETVNASGAGALSLGDNTGTIANTINNYPSEQNKTLAEAAAEMQQLLKQLEQNNPAATDAQKITYVDLSNPSLKTKVVTALKENPGLRGRVIAAIEAGRESTIDEFVLENKFLKVGKAILKGWIEGGSKK